MSGHHVDDFDNEILLVREAMKRTDPVMLATIALGRSRAECARENFTADELPVVARAMLHSTACLGSLVKTIPGVGPAAYSTTNAVLNVQACAAVMILVQDEIDALEASLRADA